MATESNLVCDGTHKAAADLSGKQFYIVKLDSSSEIALCTATTDQPFGILQNKPLAGQAASVAVGGTSKCISGAALTIGQQIGSDSAGKGTAITVAAGGTVYNYAVGRVSKASGAANGLAEVELYRAGLPLLV